MGYLLFETESFHMLYTVNCNINDDKEDNKVKKMID